LRGTTPTIVLLTELFWSTYIERNIYLPLHTYTDILRAGRDGKKFLFEVLHDVLSEIENEKEEPEKVEEGAVGEDGDSAAMGSMSPRTRSYMEEKDAEQVLSIVDTIITTICRSVEAFPHDCRIVLWRIHSAIQNDHPGRLIRYVILHPIPPLFDLSISDVAHAQ